MNQRPPVSPIPLFPLNTLLFPRGRISLQIFETRYVDMTRECLRQQTGFGVVLIQEGSEVARPGMKLNIHRVGTYCRVVDWNQLSSGLLGITVEGEETFTVLDSWREDNDLCMAEVAFRHDDGVHAEPVAVEEDFRDYVTLLEGLSSHPAIEELKLDISFDNLREVAWRLSELLPISNQEKQDLLEMVDPLQRLEQIDRHITALTQ